jgi:hypothetical protein
MEAFLKVSTKFDEKSGSRHQWVLLFEKKF